MLGLAIEFMDLLKIKTIKIILSIILLSILLLTSVALGKGHSIKLSNIQFNNNLIPLYQRPNSLRLEYTYQVDNPSAGFDITLDTPVNLSEYKWFSIDILLEGVPRRGGISFRFSNLSGQEIFVNEHIPVDYGWNNILFAIPKSDHIFSKLSVYSYNSQMGKRRLQITVKDPVLYRTLFYPWIKQTIKRVYYGIYSGGFIIKNTLCHAGTWLVPRESGLLKDIKGSILFIVINLILFLNAFMVARKFLSFYYCADYIQYLILAILAQIIFLCLLFGILGRLTVYYLLSGGLALSTIILFALKGNKKIGQQDYNLKSIQHIWLDSPIILRLFFCAAITVYCTNTILAITQPPQTYDALGYHLPFAAGWIKKAKIFIYNIIFGSSIPNIYAPSNGDLFLAWTMIPFRDDFLVSIAQIPFIISSALSIFSICRKLILKKEDALWGCVIFLLIPVFTMESRKASVDMMVVALFLTALNFIIDWLQGKGEVFGLISISSFSILIGVKYAALPFALLLIPVYIYGLLDLKKDKKKNELIRFCSAAVIVPLILSGFWYIRNWIITGSPVYPAPLKIFGYTLMDGGFTEAGYRHFMKETSIMYYLLKGDFSIFKRFSFLPDVFGPQIWLILSAVVILPFLSFKKGFIHFYIISLPFMAIFLYSNLHASAWGNQGEPYRYVYLLLPLACINIVYLMKKKDWLSSVIKIITSIFLFKSILLISEYDFNRGAFNLPFRFYSFIGLIIIIFFLFTLIIKIRGLAIMKALFVSPYLRLRSGYFRYGAICIIAILLITTISSFEQHYNQRKYGFYGEWYFLHGAGYQWIGENTNNDNIAYISHDRPYPLYGKRIQNNIYAVSVNSLSHLDYHEYKTFNATGMKDFRGNPDYKIWIENLKRHHIKYIYLDTHFENNKDIEVGWIFSNKDLFREVYTNETVKIFKLEI